MKPMKSVRFYPHFRKRRWCGPLRGQPKGQKRYSASSYLIVQKGGRPVINSLFFLFFM